MAYPTGARLQLGILRAFWETGVGEAARNDPSFYPLIATLFPEITHEELIQTDPETGAETWVTLCQHQFTRLQERHDIEDFGGDLLGITLGGLARLEEKWLEEWGPKPEFGTPFWADSNQ